MKSTAPDPLAFVLALAAVALVCAAVALRAQPGPALPRDAPPERFSAGRARLVLEDLLGQGEPHPAGSAAHARVREKVLEQFARLGCDTSVQETLARGPSGRTSIVRNVVARIPGTSAARAILLVAHYDSVGSSPGAGDDGAGIALLIEVARAVRSGPALERPLIFLASDAEEAGLVGASAFALEHPLARDIGLVLDFEARGTSGASLMFETAGANAALVRALARSSPRPYATSAAELVYKNLPQDTDFSVFRAQGLPGLNFAFIGGLAHYHTPLDDLAHLDLRSLQQQGDNALGLVRELARETGAPQVAESVVFTDVLSLCVLRWPESWSAPLAALPLALACWAIARVLRRGSVRWRQLLFGLLASGAIPAACIAGSWLWGKLLVLSRGAPDPFLAQPWPGRVALLSGTLALAALVGGVALVPRAGFLASWLAPFALASLASLLSAFALVEANALALLPAFGGALALASGALARPDERWRARACAALVAAIVALSWFPIAVAMDQGFGFLLAPALAAPLSVIGVALAPAFALAGSRTSLRTAVLSGALALAATLAGFAWPAHSAEKPAWLNLRYLESDGARDPHWEASTFGAELPSALARGADFAPAHEPPFPWLTLDPSLHVAPAPVWDAPSPEISVLGEERVAGERIVRARIRSPRGATRLHLHLPPEVELRSVSWREHVLREGYASSRTHLFFAVEPEGLELELAVRGDAPAEIWLLDQDWAMPPAFEALRALRPSEFVPRSDGDVSILATRLQLR